MTTAHDRLDETNTYVTEIARLLVESEDLEGDWQAAALGVILSGTVGVDSAGFKYRADGKVIPIAPRERAIYDRLRAYRDFQAQQSGDRPWKSCLIQIDRAANSFEIIVEYDDALRWKITPKNLKEMRESMRP